MSLKKVIIVARHGARDPMSIFPTIKQDTWENSTKHELNSREHIFEMIKKANLTDKGKNMCYQLGLEIFNKYKNLLNVEKILTVSSPVLRTIESAKYFQLGLLGYEYDVHTDTILAGDIRFTEEERREYNKISQHVDLEIDTTEIKELIYKYLGRKVVNSSDYFEIKSSLDCYKSENIDISSVPDEVINKIYDLALLYYKKLFENEYVLELFSRKTMEYIEKIMNDSTINVAYLSTHDVVIYPIIKKLGFNEKLPNFVSYIKYEIYDDRTKIFYDEVELNRNN